MVPRSPAAGSDERSGLARAARAGGNRPASKRGAQHTTRRFLQVETRSTTAARIGVQSPVLTELNQSTDSEAAAVTGGEAAANRSGLQGPKK